MLPYTEEVLVSLFGQYNRSIWPAHVLFYAMALAGVALALRPRKTGDRLIGVIFAAAWAWVGIGLFFLNFAAIDFSAPAYGVIFLVQAVLLTVTVVIRGKVIFRLNKNNFFCRAALVFLFFALVVFPLLDLMAGYEWESVRVFGAGPGPTMLLTVGVLLLVDGRPPVHLAIIPLVWAFKTAVTAAWLDMPHDIGLAIVAALGISLIIWKVFEDSPQPEGSSEAPSVDSQHIRKG
ncbi:MAG: DUF6064 family protein [Opitutales bacterium]